MKRILFILIFLSVTNSSFSFDLFPKQNKGKAGLPGEFLSNFGSSAESLGRGKTGVVLSDNPGSVYFNPAALGTSVTRKLSFLNSNLFYGTSFNYLGYAHPFIDRFAVAISAVSLETDGVEEVSEIGEATGRSFGETERCYILSYAKRLSKRFDWGLNLKFITEDLLDYSGSSYGLDLGILWRIPSLSSNFGFTIQNIFQPSIKLKNAKETYPMNLRFGYSLEAIKNFIVYQDFLYQNIFPKKNLFKGNAKPSFYFNTGLEYRYKNFTFRTGMDNKDYSFGFGLKTRYVDFDYAINSGYLGITHHFSLSFNFGLLPTEQERRLEELRRELEMKSLYTNALYYFNNENTEKAKKYVKECLTKYPEYKKAKKLLQEIELKERKIEARRLYEEAFLLFEKGKDKEANEKVKKAVELYPDIKKILIEEYFDKAKEYMEEKQYEECKKALTKVLRINPEHKKASEMLRKLESIMEILK